MNRRALARQAAGAKNVTSPVDADTSGSENVTRKLEAQLVKGDYYSALQMYKTLFMRYLKNEPEYEQQLQAIELALDASLNLIKHDQNTAAIEMANLMVSVYSDYNWSVEDNTMDRIRKINAAFEEKPQYSADLAVFLKNAVKWSSLEGHRKRGDPELQLLLARAFYRAKDFQHAAKHYLHSEKPSEFATVVFEWSKGGYPSEVDLYLARAVLQLLSLENMRDANKVYEEYTAKAKADGQSVDTPLYNFLRFLLLTLERDAMPLFQLLQDRYAASLSRDPSLKNYLSIIGQKFYKIQPPRSGLSSLLEMFGGGM